MLADRIMDWANRAAMQRQPPSKIGAWNVGRCPRALHLMLHGAPAEPLTGRTLLVFDLGDRIETAIFELLEKAGVGFVRTDESRDTVACPPVGRVRADGFIQDGAEIIPVEIKSMSDFAFDRADKKKEIDEGYRAQAECYVRAYNARRCLVLGYRKETSHLVEVIHERSDAVWSKVCANVAAATGDAQPLRPYALIDSCEECKGTGKTLIRGQAHKACAGTGKVPGGPYIPNFPCGYCAWKVACWGPLEMVMLGEKPKWRVTEPVAQTA